MAGRAPLVGPTVDPRGRLRRQRQANLEPWDIRLFRWFGTTLGVLCAAYLFLDRGVAHFHPPKIRVAFIGELTLALAVVALLYGTRWLRQAVHRDVLVIALIAYMVWGLIRSVPNMSIFGLQTVVRDAALWYYAGFAVALIVAATAVPDLPQRLVHGFRRVVPWLALWLPIALLLQRSGVKGPHFRYSGVPLFSHRPGNVCCAAVICVAFVLLVPERSTGSDDDGSTPTFFVRPYPKLLKGVVLALALVAILLGATQTRGGGAASLVGVLLAFFLMDRRRRSKIMIPLVLGITLVLGLGLVTGFTLHTKHRTISVSQLFQNAQSLSGASTQEQGSVTFRTSLWSTILHEQSTTSRIITGYGYGPNLAKIGGIVERQPQSATAQELQSAHNSLLDIFARGGLIGASLFATVWLGWFRRLSRSSRRSHHAQDRRGVIGVCLCGALAIFMNCFFDPTLEGAQVAAVLFTLFGIGLMCDRMATAETLRRRWGLTHHLTLPAI